MKFDFSSFEIEPRYYLNSEINNFNGGLLLEVWTKGTVWDKALGYKFIKLYSIPQHFNHSVQWYQLDTDLILENGEVSGTKNPTDHLIMLDCKFEVPLGKLLI